MTKSLKDSRVIYLNAVIGGLVIIVGYLAYSLLARHVIHPPVDAERTAAPPGSVIQIDVLNGSGASGVASSFTSYLRSRGFDVVDTRNYRSSDLKESLVIDRTGNREDAEKVAYALGVKKENIVQQLNEDYYVDVSVVIGKDHKSLKPSQ